MLKLNMLLYCMIHNDDIKSFVAIETNGKEPYMINKEHLKLLIEKYLINAENSIDSNVRSIYTQYICDWLLPN